MWRVSRLAWKLSDPGVPGALSVLASAPNSLTISTLPGKVARRRTSQESMAACTVAGGASVSSYQPS